MMPTGNKPTSAMRVSEALRVTSTWQHTHTQRHPSLKSDSASCAAQQPQAANGFNGKPSFKCNIIFSYVKKELLFWFTTIYQNKL